MPDEVLNASEAEYDEFLRSYFQHIKRRRTKEDFEELLMRFNNLLSAIKNTTPSNNSTSVPAGF